jgi:type VI secretion system protein ImpL
MIRIVSRIFLAVLLAAIVWWIGPLVAIGIYRPLEWSATRLILVALVLAWGCWPTLSGLGYRFAARVRRDTPSVRRLEPDAIAGRVQDLECRLRDRWQRQTPAPLARWWGRLNQRHRALLPFLLVLGPPSSGKTQLIAAAQGSVDHGRDADAAMAAAPEGGGNPGFRLAKDAVWIDTRGGWATHDGMNEVEREVWTRLLQTLRGLRVSRPLDGVVICLDCAQLASMPEEGRKALAETLRARLRDLGEAHAQVVPLYLALSRLDKLDGAVAMLALMASQRWADGLGFALGQPIGTADVSSQWRAAWLALEDRVQRQVLHLAPQADVTANRNQLRFVEALGQLREPLLEFLHAIVAPGQAQQIADLRGVWFGSAAEVLDGADEVDAPHDVQHRVSGGLPLARLWLPLFKQAQLEEAVRPIPGSRSFRIKLRRYLKWTLTATVITLLFGWILWGYVEERDHLTRVWAQFAEGKRLAEQQADEHLTSDARLLRTAEQMRYALINAEDTSQAMPTGYGEHSRVAQVAAKTYHRHLRKSFMPELHNFVRQTLEEQVKGDQGDIFQTLKIYLMLAQPQRRSATDLEQWLTERWEPLSGEQYTAEDQRVLMAHARNLFMSADIPGTPEDPSLVRMARARATQTPSVSRVLQRIRKAGLPSRIQGVSLSSAAGFGASTTLKLRSALPATDTAVSGWYTRAGYLDAFRPALESSARHVLEEESWVLRNEAVDGNAFEVDKTVQKLADATREQFLQDYIREWKKFLADVGARYFTGLDDAAQLAGALVDPQSALAQLIRFSARETSLTGNYDGDVDSWIERQKLSLEKKRRAIVGEMAGEQYRAKLLPEYVVDDQFQALHQIGKQLGQLSSDASSNPMSRLFEPVYRQLGLVGGAMQAGQVPSELDAFARLRAIAVLQPEPVRGVILDLINSASAMTAKQSGSILNREATAAARSMCDRGVAARYPLKKASKSDAGIVDFERLFGPQGAMATQFREQLAAHVDTSASPWRARGIEGGGGPLLSADVIRNYEIADRIRSTMFDSAGNVRFSATLRFLDMSPQLAEAELEIGPQRMRYAHGTSSPTRINWQPQGNNVTVRLRLRSIDGRTETMQFDGPWALLRFFDNGRTSTGGAERRETEHQSQLGSVRIEWQTESTPSPLWSNLLASFKCPQ